MIPAPICPYCGKESVLVSGKIVYPHHRDLAGLSFWQCAPCDAYVGCHREGVWTIIDGEKITSDGTLPLGRLANAELREAKQKAHYAFDPIWKRNADITRHEAYTWLRIALGLSRQDGHIGEFDIEQCNAVVKACKAREEVSRGLSGVREENKGQ